MSPAVQTPLRATRKAIRIGSVSFLNAKPLIYGLDDCRDVELALDVPSRLLDGLLSERFDVALLPVIDYQRMPGLRLITAGGIGCDGPTLTVRIFSQTPISEIHTLACDTDSHTSVALARIVLAERYAIRPKIVPWDTSDDITARIAFPPGTARLLIGDKVVSHEPQDMPYQVDLGEAWKELTGLPFVFAAWMVRGEVDITGLWSTLESAKRLGLENVDAIIARHAPQRHWPLDVAKKYLMEYLEFDITPRHLQAIRLFHRLAHEHGLLEQPPRDLVLLNSD